jgi:hypothetical protein
VLVPAFVPPSFFPLSELPLAVLLLPPPHAAKVTIMMSAKRAIDKRFAVAILLPPRF